MFHHPVGELRRCLKHACAGIGAREEEKAALLASIGCADQTYDENELDHHCLPTAYDQPGG